MNQIALERQNDIADIPLLQALEAENFDFEEIMTLAAEIEIDED